MFKSLKHGKDIALRIVFVMKMFWSFGFVSFGIVSNLVLRYSDISPAKENDYVGPFQGPSSSHRFYRWSLTSPYKGKSLSVAFCQAPEFPAGVNFLDGEVMICFKFLPKQQRGVEYEDITETLVNLDHIVVCHEPYPYFWIKQMAQ